MNQAERRALLALALIVPAPSVGAAMAFWVAPGPVGSVAYALGKLVLYGLPLVWHRFVDGQPLSWSPPRRGGLGLGALLGLLLAAGVTAAYFSIGNSLLDPSALALLARDNGFDTAGRYLVIAVWLCTGNAALEEYSFRWFVFTRFRTLLGQPAAVGAAGVAFTVHHLIVLRAFFSWPLALLCSLGVLVGGLLWSWCYERFASVWPGWLSHVLVDLAVLGIGWHLLFSR